MGDPYRLNQVFLNVMSNAIKFTERGEVDIAVTVVNDMKDEQLLRVTIKDTGIGMDEPFVKSLFEKFSQEDASVTRQYGGTGLGMSICKELIELMGGVIRATSKKGVGSSVIFEVTFPKGIATDLPSKETFVATNAIFLFLSIYFYESSSPAIKFKLLMVIMASLSIAPLVNSP